MDKVYIRELIKTILTYKMRILLIIGLTAGFSYQLTVWMTKKYMSSFEINVYSKYFQNPLISGVIPDLYNIPEMRFAIDSMVKEAISDDFIDEIGTDYGIYEKDIDDKQLAKQRQLLRDNFSYYSTGGQSYSISFTHSDPYKAKEIIDKTMKLVKDHIVNKRIRTIELVKEVMIRKLNSYNASQKFVQQGADKALASKSPEVLREELVKVTTSIEAMSKQYKETHPIIANLKSRQKVISEWLSEYDISKYSDAVDLPMAMTDNKIVSEQLSSKFYQKYHDFNIALEIEKKSLESYIGVIKRPQLPTSPIWPKKRLFISLGFVLGLVIAFIYVYISEVIIPSREEKLQMESDFLGAPILGFIPAMKTKPVKSKVTINELEEVLTLG